MVKNLVNKVINRLKVYVNYKKFTKNIPVLTNVTIFPPNQKIAIVNFYSKRLERHYYFILKFLSENDYQILLVNNKISIGCWFSFGDKLSCIPNLHIINEIPAIQKGWLYFTDNKEKKVTNNGGKHIHVRVDIFNADKSDPDTLMMPLPMSVDIYASGEHKKLDQHRKNKKNSKIIYSGNLDTNYNNDSLRSIYKINTRPETIHAIKTQLTDSELLIIKDFNKFIQLSKEGYINKFILFYWYWNGANHDLKGRIENADWLSTISGSDFFLGSPGVVMPATHAIVESMSVGCIPLLQCPDFYVPALTDGVNCIVYTTLDDLIDKIRYILSLPKHKIDEIRDNAIMYYDNYLTPEAYIKNIESMEGSNIEYFMYTDYSHL